MPSSDDFSRVKLKEIPGEEGSDYINASHLDVRARHNLLAYIHDIVHVA